MAAYTGARRGELLALRWPGVDLDAKTVTISGSAGVVNGERIEGTTKTGRSRMVTLDEETVNVLKAHHKAHRKAQLADKHRLGDEGRGEKNGHVFLTGWGAPIYPDTVTPLIRDLVKVHNAQEGVDLLPFSRLHDLRHIHATTPLLAGFPVHVVAARLGHADPAITLRVYAHVIRTAEVRAAEVFAEAIK
ncbi:site-specific integrase [Nonomuraea dietziae]|uniref:site-specific integrase n=1 Tax=Nonomuraea dietziae TaxID=65515 RepID=UPI003F4D58E5